MMNVLKYLSVLGPVSIAACTQTEACPGGCGTAVIAMIGRADAVVPPFVTTSNGNAISEQLFLKLADIGPDLRVHGDLGFTPKLADAWTFEDSLTIAFHLNPDATWHDGRAVTAEDVAFTFGLVKDTLVNSPLRSDIESIAAVTARDERTVVFTFTHHYSEQFYDATHHVRILPAHLLADVPRGELRLHSFNTRPVGNGPYRFLRWIPGESIELRAQENFFLGPPGIGRLIWRVVPDLSVAVNQVVAGEVDIVEFLGPPANVARVEASPGIQVLSYPAAVYFYIAFNSRDPEHTGSPHRLFRDAAVRRAVALALDRHLIARTVLGDEGTVPPGPMSRLLWIWDDEMPPLPFDSAAARRLLGEAAWIDHDGDGVLDRQGQALEFELLVPSSSGARRQAAVIIQDQLERIGIRVVITELEYLTWLDRSQSGRFDATFGAWSQNPSPSAIRQTWTTGSALNYGRYSNAEFDTLVRDAMAAPTVERARELWGRAISVINADVPAIWIMSPMQAAAVSTRFTNVSLRPDNWAATLWQWRVRSGSTAARGP